MEAVTHPPTLRHSAVAEGSDRSTTFATLLTPVLPRAYRVALHLTRNSSDAEDLVQDTALQALRHFDQFRLGTNFRAWFLQILMNAFRMKYRRERARPTGVSLDAAPDLYLYGKLGAGAAPPDADPVGSFLSRLDTDQISEAIRQLPKEYRSVATLYFLEDLSYQEMADALSCPIGTVRSRLHRARRMLQRHLWRIAEDNGVA